MTTTRAAAPSVAVWDRPVRLLHWTLAAAVIGAGRGIIATGSDTLGPDATSDLVLQATTRTLFHGGITLENVGTGLARMRPHGDWIAVNGNRPAFSGFQMGFTGYTVR